MHGTFATPLSLRLPLHPTALSGHQIEAFPISFRYKGCAFEFSTIFSHFCTYQRRRHRAGARFYAFVPPLHTSVLGNKTFHFFRSLSLFKNFPWTLCSNFYSTRPYCRSRKQKSNRYFTYSYGKIAKSNISNTDQIPNGYFRRIYNTRRSFPMCAIHYGVRLWYNNTKRGFLSSRILRSDRILFFFFLK